MAVERDDVDWREVIYRGVEDQQLDYKAAQDWNELNGPDAPSSPAM